MVLELMVNPRKATGKPLEIIALGFVYAIVSVLLASWIFKSYVTIVMITFTIIASLPLVNSIINSEEKKDLTLMKERKILKQHSKAIAALLCLFLGYTLAFALLYIFLPSAITDSIFSAQLETIASITEPTGNYISTSGAFTAILSNNIKILVFCIAFSFFYGAGAIFILSWNASVMATAIGIFIKNNMIHMQGAISFLHISTVGILQYFLHGIPEIIAYFIGALASGMISFALVKHDFMDKNFKVIITDVIDLLAISLLIIVLAALIEIFVTPLIYA